LAVCSQPSCHDVGPYHEGRVHLGTRDWDIHLRVW